MKNLQVKVNYSHCREISKFNDTAELETDEEFDPAKLYVLKSD